jgi:hypothetical protein
VKKGVDEGNPSRIESGGVTGSGDEVAYSFGIYQRLDWERRKQSLVYTFGKHMVSGD